MQYSQDCDRFFLFVDLLYMYYFIGLELEFQATGPVAFIKKQVQ